MKILIVEDDFVSSTLLKAILVQYGECVMAVNGTEAVTFFTDAVMSGTPFDLVCLDIMLPELDGQNVLKSMRRIEQRKGIEGLDAAKVVMITALGDHRSIMDAFRSQCEGYIVKPIRKDKVIRQLCDLGLMRPSADTSGQKQ
jgi:two-component system chemotaxis response regulator CheY